MKKMLLLVLMVLICVSTFAQKERTLPVSRKLLKKVYRETSITKDLIERIFMLSGNDIIEFEYFNKELDQVYLKGIELSFNQNIFGVNLNLIDYIDSLGLENLIVYQNGFKGYSCSSPNEYANKIIIHNKIGFEELLEIEKYKIPYKKREETIVLLKKWNKKYGLKFSLIENNIASFDIINQKLLDSDIDLVLEEIKSITEPSKEILDRGNLDGYYYYQRIGLESGDLLLRWYCKGQ